MRGLKRQVLGGAMMSILVLLFAVLYIRGKPDRDSVYSRKRREKGVRTILGPINASFASVSIERHNGLAFRLMAVVGHDHSPSEADIDKAFSVTRTILDRHEPLTIFYDLRDVHWLPSRAAVSRVLRWVQEPRNAVDLDAQLQCISFAMRPGLVRTAATAVVRVFGPPQPVHIGADEASALDWARANCGKQQNWGGDKSRFR